MKTEKPKQQTTKTDKVLIPYARVSSLIQTADDKTGIERQLLSARKCVAAHPGWTLDENFNLIDLAKSGYKGKNLEPDAALGGFLKALRDGKIPLTPTKVLHIDDMSRLSRLPIKKARALFEGILDSGVEIYNEQANKLYTSDSLDNSMDLIMSLLEIEAAHKYAKNIGEKVKSAWSIKHQRAIDTGKPYKFKCPAWLKWNESKQCYDAIPEKVEAVRRVFELACMGIGIRGIATRMNAEKHPVITKYNGPTIKTEGWYKSSITHLLRQKKVLGLNENLNPPVAMYPQVITDKVYYKAQAKIEEHKTHKYYGRSSDKPKNVFAGLAECSKCGRPMGIVRHCIPKNEATGSRGGRLNYAYLKCHGISEGTCKNSQLSYDKIEESFAMMLSGSQFVNAYSETKPEKGSQVDELQGKIADTHTRLERYTADYEKSPSVMLAGLMNKTELQEKELRAELEQAKAVSVGTSPVEDTRNEFLAILYKGWYDPDVRLKLRELIRAVVDKLIVNGPDKCYMIHWKNGDKPTHVQIFRKAYKIDKILIPMIPDWEKEIVRAGEVIKRQEAEKWVEPTTPKKPFAQLFQEDDGTQPHWVKGTFAKLTTKTVKLAKTDKPPKVMAE